MSDKESVNADKGLQAEHGLGLKYRLQDSAQDDVVERVLLKRGWTRFELIGPDGEVVPLGSNQDLAPPEVGVNGPNCPYNLHFKRGRFVKTEFSKAMRPANPNRLRINHFQGTDLITHKGKLLRLMNKLKAQHGSSFNFAPEGYILPSEYTKFTKAYSKYRSEDACWIVKPQVLSQGQGITLVKDLSDLKYDSQSVIQRYIDRPLLIGGYKFDLRLYVLISRAHPMEIWLFDDGIVRFSTEKYQHPSDEGFRPDQLLGHLTNASIHKNSTTYAEDKDVIGRGCKWDFRQWKNWFREQGRPLAYFVVWERIKTLVRLTTLPLLTVLPRSEVPFEVLGFDVMVDADLKPWLIETNAAPALGLESEVDRRVKPKLINDMVDALDFRGMHSRANQMEAREVERLAVFAQSSADGNDSKTLSQKSSNSKRTVQTKQVDQVAGIPGQVLSPSTAAQHITAQNSKPKRSVSAKGGRLSRKRGSSAGTKTTSFRTNGIVRQSSKTRTKSKGQKHNSSAEDSSSENILWQSRRTRAGGFELIYPFSAETQGLAQSTAQHCGKPVELDKVLKQSFALVRTHHKTSTSRARKLFALAEAEATQSKDTSVVTQAPAAQQSGGVRAEKNSHDSNVTPTDVQARSSGNESASGGEAITGATKHLHTASVKEDTSSPQTNEVPVKAEAVVVVNAQTEAAANVDAEVATNAISHAGANSDAESRPINSTEVDDVINVVKLTGTDVGENTLPQLSKEVGNDIIVDVESDDKPSGHHNSEQPKSSGSSHEQNVVLPQSSDVNGVPEKTLTAE